MTFSCHGGNNQDIRFDGEQILVGGLCLDVEGGQNRDRAQVIAYPCHGGQNQKWRMNANGTIQSLLGGEARCIGTWRRKMAGRS